MPDIEIRAAVPGDAAVIVTLLRALADTLGEGEKFRSTEASILRHGFGEDRLLWTMLALDGEQAVGLASYFPTFSTTRGASGVYVQDLYVVPEARGQAIGRRLLAAVSRDAAAGWGAAYLTLLVYDGNSDARAFYQRLGFILPDNERPAFLEGAALAALGQEP